MENMHPWLGTQSFSCSHGVLRQMPNVDPWDIQNNIFVPNHEIFCPTSELGATQANTNSIRLTFTLPGQSQTLNWDASGTCWQSVEGWDWCDLADYPVLQAESNRVRLQHLVLLASPPTEPAITEATKSVATNQNPPVIQSALGELRQSHPVLQAMSACYTWCDWWNPPNPNFPRTLLLLVIIHW